MSDFDRNGFEEVPDGRSELPPVPPEFAEIPDSSRPASIPAPAGISSDERGWAMGAHLSPFIIFVMPLPGMNVLAPLIIWLMKKDTMPYVGAHAKEALNFNISFLIWGVAALIVGLLLFVVGVFLTLPLVGLVWFILTIVGTAKAGNNEIYEYPLTIRFVK